MNVTAVARPGLSSPDTIPLDTIDFLGIPPSEEFIRLIPHEFARRHLILSLGTSSHQSNDDLASSDLRREQPHPFERLVVAPSTRPAAIYNVGVVLGRAVTTVVSSAESIASAIDRAYAAAPQDTGHADEVVVETSSSLDEDVAATIREAESDLLSTAGKAQTVRLVDLVLFEALLKGASDVHIQPVRGRTLVRYRLDGVLHTARELPLSLASSVVSRIKVMARLDVAEQRSPQDGRATVSIGSVGAGGTQGRTHTGRRIDMRVASLPSTYGERVVLRLLDPARSPHLLSLTALGMPPAIERAYKAQCSRTSGIVLSTGPTGSGKTTTLYTTLGWIGATNSPPTPTSPSATSPARGVHGSESTDQRRAPEGGSCELNMMTIEDPVEYDLSSSGLPISQTQVDPKKSLTFATGLRHILRQDPDVIMVGEIRDEETARIAVQSSLTGHLVLSTLHTNDAASAVARLIDLGVEPFLVASSLSAVLAQRLVRRVHQPCRGLGCPDCLGSGHKGRTGVFELLVLDADLKDMVNRRCPALDMKIAAQRKGMVTLREAGESLVREGITSTKELARVLEAVEEVPS